VQTTETCGRDRRSTVNVALDRPLWPERKEEPEGEYEERENEGISFTLWKGWQCQRRFLSKLNRRKRLSLKKNFKERGKGFTKGNRNTTSVINMKQDQRGGDVLVTIQIVVRILGVVRRGAGNDGKNKSRTSVITHTKKKRPEKRGLSHRIWGGNFRVRFVVLR